MDIFSRLYIECQNRDGNREKFFKHENQACPPALSDNRDNINDWMRASRLRLNPSKTQVMWLGTKQQLDKITIKDIPLLSTIVTVVDSARNLGVSIDSQLSMDVHVAAVCRSGYYQLRQLRLLTRSLTTAAAETVVHAFVSSRLDYCNALLYGVSDRLMRRLQSVQNAAARLVTGVPRSPHHSDPATTPLATRATARTL